MFWRQPPPPKSRIPTWAGLAVPITFAIIIGLLSIVYNGLAADVEKIEDKMEQKVDNKTMQMQIEVLKEKHKTAKEFRTKTNDRIERILLQMQQVQRTPPPNSGQGSLVTREQYNFYIKLSPEQKIQFKKLHPEFQGLP